MSDPKVTEMTHILTVKELMEILGGMDPNAAVVVREDSSVGAIAGVEQVIDPEALDLLFEDFHEVPSGAVIIEAEF